MADATIADLAAVTDLVGTDEYILMRAGVSKKIDASDLASEILALAPGGGGLFDAYAVLQDVKSSGTAGGTFTSGAWQTRVLNTELSDPSGIVSLSSNQFTLATGAYWITAVGPGRLVDNNKLRIQNITDTVQEIQGVNAQSQSNAGANSMAHLSGRLVVASGPKVYELQHRCQTTGTTTGFGEAASFSGVSEIYAMVTIMREA